MVCSLAQVGGTGLGVEVGPEGLDDLVPGELMVLGQRQQLHQLTGSTGGPRVRVDPAVIDADVKAAEQSDVHRWPPRSLCHASSLSLDRPVERTGGATAHPTLRT